MRTARYVSQLDFYWITDHAESYTPQHWKDVAASYYHGIHYRAGDECGMGGYGDDYP